MTEIIRKFKGNRSEEDIVQNNNQKFRSLSQSVDQITMQGVVDDSNYKSKYYFSNQIIRSTKIGDQIKVFNKKPPYNQQMCLRIERDKVRMNMFQKFSANILKVLDHPDIIKVYDCLTMDKDKYIQIIYEYLDCNSLLEQQMVYGKIPENKCIQILQSMLRILVQLKSKNIVLNDIRPESFLVIEYDDYVSVKLIEPGLQNTLGILTDDSIQYRSPESLLLSPRVSFRSDLWSVLIIYQTMLQGFPPFQDLKRLTKTTVPQQINNILLHDSESPQDIVFPDTIGITTLSIQLCCLVFIQDIRKRSHSIDLLKQIKFKQPKQQTIFVDFLTDKTQNKSIQLFKSTVCQIIFNNCNMTQINQLKLLFDELDVDHDGKILLIDFKMKIHFKFKQPMNLLDLLLENQNVKNKKQLSWKVYSKVMLNFINQDLKQFEYLLYDSYGILDKQKWNQFTFDQFCNMTKQPQDRITEMKAGLMIIWKNKIDFDTFKRLISSVKLQENKYKQSFDESSVGSILMEEYENDSLIRLSSYETFLQFY